MQRGRGRPISFHYLRVRDRFIEAANEKLRAAGKTRTWLAKNAVFDRGDRILHVNKGAVSEIFSRRRVASLPVLYALMDALEFGPDLVKEFAWGPPPFRRRAEPRLISDYNYPRPELLEPVTLLIRQFYAQAYQMLLRIIDSAVEKRDLILEADAAARMAWLLLESGAFGHAEQYVNRSIKKAGQAIKLPVANILRSVEPLRAGDQSQAAIALRILSDAHHLRSQILVSRMLYLEDEGLESSARVALAENMKLDRKLALREPMGNDLRWMALLEVTVKNPDLKPALRLIDEAGDKFDHGGLYEAHLTNASGLVHLRAGKPTRGRKLLLEAQAKLSLTADARGLALNMNSLSDAPLLGSDNIHKPFRYLLAAGALHPYGFLVERLRNRARYIEPRRFQTEIDSLLAGNPDYKPVHQIMTRLALGSPHMPNDLLYRNIDLMLAGCFPSLTLPFRRPESH